MKKIVIIEIIAAVLVGVGFLIYFIVDGSGETFDTKFIMSLEERFAKDINDSLEKNNNTLRIGSASAFDADIYENEGSADFVYYIQSYDDSGEESSIFTLTYNVNSKNYSSITESTFGTRGYSKAYRKAMEEMEFQKYEFVKKINDYSEYSDYYDNFCKNISDDLDINAFLLSKGVICESQEIDGDMYYKVELYGKAIVDGDGTVTVDPNLGCFFGNKKTYENSIIKTVKATVYIQELSIDNKTDILDFCIKYYLELSGFIPRGNSCEIDAKNISLMQQDVMENYCKIFSYQQNEK